MRSKKNDWLDEFARAQAERQSTPSMSKTASSVSELPMNALIVDPADFPNVKQGSIVRLDQDYIVVNASYKDEFGAGLVIVPEKKVTAKDLRKNRMSKEAGGAQEYNRVDPGNIYDLNPPSDQVDQQRWEQAANETQSVMQQENSRGPRDTVQRHYEKPVTSPGGMGMGMPGAVPTPSTPAPMTAPTTPAVAPEDMVSDVENFDVDPADQAPEESEVPETSDDEFEVDEVEEDTTEEADAEVETETEPEEEMEVEQEEEEEEEKKLPVAANRIMARIMASRKSVK